MVVTGFGFMLHLAASNTLFKTLAREGVWGRVMALDTTASLGLATFGSPLAGVIADHVGASRTLMAGGLLCILCAAIFRQKLLKLREKVRPVYIAKGILPEVTKLSEEVEQ